jgi:hypothetical protein
MRYLSGALAAVAVLLFGAFPLAAQQAQLVLLPPNQAALIGDTAKFCVTFDNVGLMTGLGPFLDLFIDAGGANVVKSGPPAHLCDGLAFVSATVISTNPPVPLVPEPVANIPCATGPASIQHPYAANGFTGVAGLNGQQLVTLPLPFGSFTVLQPPMRIEVTVKIDSFADQNHPLKVGVRGAFRWNGPASLSANWWQNATVIPRAVILTNEYLGTDKEIVSGHPQKFDLTVKVSPASNVAGLTVTDVLPAGGTWSGPNAPPQTWPLLAAGSTTTITPAFTSGNVPPLTPPFCNTPFNTTASITAGAWTPPDPADTALPLNTSASANITRRALAVQQQATVPNPNGPLPGGQIVYRIDFQSAHELRFGNLVVTDTLTDGQVYVPGSGKLTISDRFATLTVMPLDPFISPVVHNVNQSYVCPPPAHPCKPVVGLGGGPVPNGNRYVFNVSQAMIQNAPSAPHNLGVLSGGASTLGASSAAPAFGTIDFTVNLTDAFSNGHGDDGKLSKHDPLYAVAIIKGTQYTKPALTPVPIAGATCADTGSSCLAVPGDTLSKDVFAINGVKLSTPQNPLVPFPVTRGDVVTFRTQKTIPSGDAEKVTVTDWFPQPVFNVASFTTHGPCTTSVMPLLAGHTCYSVPAYVPPVTRTVTAVPDNSVQFDLHTFNNTANQAGTLNLYSSLAVSTAPFPDGLLLTNEVQECESSSYGGPRICQEAIAQIKLQEPSLRIRKAVFCAGGCGQPSCAAGCPPASVITSQQLPGLGTASVNGDAGDIVTFVVSIENVGSAPHGAYDVQLSDTLGTIPGTIVSGSFCVRRGTGATLVPGLTGYVLSPASPANAWTLALANQGTLGSIPPLNATTAASGANVILIFYSVKLNPPATLTVGQCHKNTSKLMRYSNRNGGQNFVGAAGLPAIPPVSAEICTVLKDAKKGVVTTSEPHTPMPRVTIGEIVQYELRVDIPEGSVPALTFIDTLPVSMELLAPPVVTTAGFTSPPLLSPLNSSTSIKLALQIPAFVNNDNDAGCETLIVRFNALVMNDGANVNNHLLQNKFTVQSAGGPLLTSTTVGVVVTEPKLTVTKSVKDISVPPVTAGAYTVAIANTSLVAAFNIVVDDIPGGACMQAPTGAQVATTGVVTGVGSWAGTWPLKIASMAPGSTVKITYSRVLHCKTCQEMTDRIVLTWTSLPGAGTPAGLTNTTGAVTPGGSGAMNGERDGSTVLLPNYYFAESAAAFCGKVCGVKFSDTNGDGIRQSTEPPLANWIINANLGNSIAATTTTAADGSYCLDLLPSATLHVICELAQPPWTQTRPPAASPCYPLLVGPGTSATGKDFGNKPCTAKLCGRKFDDKHQPLAGWTIVAWPNDPSLPPVVATTNTSGEYCLTLEAPHVYTGSEIGQNGWVELKPATGGTAVTVECGKDANGAWVGNAVPNLLDFVNRNVCAGVACPAGQQCIAAPDGSAQCVTPPAITPCAVVRCRFGWHCAVVNGEAVCVP